MENLVCGSLEYDMNMVIRFNWSINQEPYPNDLDDDKPARTLDHDTDNYIFNKKVDCCMQAHTEASTWFLCTNLEGTSVQSAEENFIFYLT